MVTVKVFTSCLIHIMVYFKVIVALNKINKCDEEMEGSGWLNGWGIYVKQEGLSYFVMSRSDLGMWTSHFLNYFSFSFSVILEF